MNNNKDVYRPGKTLLLGNGINRAFSKNSWDDMLKSVATRNDFEPGKMNAPMPLRAVILTDDKIDQAAKNLKEMFCGEITDLEHGDLLRRLLSAGFDDVLTTNYSYELETAAKGAERLSEGQIAGMMRHTEGNRAEARYLLHTFNEVACEGRNNRIWHVHGESRKPDSMLLGHYWYGNLTARIAAEVKSNGNRYRELEKKNAPLPRNSWIDGFLLDDLFILGFGFDLSEIDLWWLLNRRKREKARKGKIVFYDPRIDLEENRERKALLELMDVKTVSFAGYGIEKEDYQEFYRRAVRDICDVVKERG